MNLQENKELSQAFIEEVTDLLTEIEDSLMQINSGTENPDIIARVFRSLHTIKGSAGMFGFMEISSFVHDLETTFDNIRQGRMKLSSEIIGLTLKAQDRIRNLLLKTDNEEEKISRDSILDELKRITASVNIPENEGNLEPKNDSGDYTADKEKNVHGQPESYRIKFRPSPGILLRGIKLRPLFKELAGLGKLSLTAKLTNFPDLDAIDPESCYFEWEAILVSDMGIGDIKNVFIFVNDYAEVEITKDDALGLAKPADNEQTQPVVFEKRKSDLKSIRVKNEKLDLLINLVGELVTLNARFRQEAGQSRIPEFISLSESFNRLIADLRDNTMSIRMVQLSELFNSYNRLVFDLANKLNKKIKLQINGGQTELDKNMIEELRDPLMHLIRNSADHGIETSEARIAAGKPESGTILLNAEHSGSNVLIKISDDGAGLNKEKIRKKAVEAGLLEPSVNEESVIFSKIFEPGFSTADQATDVSGRGVGLDVVKRNIEKLRGSISVSSRSNEGMTVLLTIPLTLAIIDGFMFELAGELYIFNLSNVIECLDYGKAADDLSTGQFTISLRGDMISCLDLKKVLGIGGERNAFPQVVITDLGGERVGFLVDRLIGKYQTVIKPVAKSVNTKDIIVGATILGNGSIAFVLDINKVITFAQDSSGNNSKHNNLIK